MSEYDLNMKTTYFMKQKLNNKIESQTPGRYYA